jgi:hypothetical protein
MQCSNRNLDNQEIILLPCISFLKRQQGSCKRLRVGHAFFAPWVYTRAPLGLVVSTTLVNLVVSISNPMNTYTNIVVGPFALIKSESEGGVNAKDEDVIQDVLRGLTPKGAPVSVRIRDAILVFNVL